MYKYIVCFLFLFAGCTQQHSSESSWFNAHEKLRVLSTIGMIHDLVQEIGGEHVNAIVLIRSELDPHTYELVKGDDEKFACADLIFYNGLGLEHGLSLRQNLERNGRAVAVASSILERNPEAIIRVDGQYDPHVWMDIALWMQTVDPIVHTLCAKDPAHAQDYQERGQRLLEKMRCADAEAYGILQAISPKKRYLVTSHDAFNYFARHYLADTGEESWSARCEAPEGLAPEAQMSVSDVMEVIAHVQKFDIRVLFPESNVSPDSLKKICAAASEKGLPIRLCPRTLYGDSMGGASSYLEMIRHNVAIIAEELGQ